MRAAPPDLPGSHSSDSPLDRALALLLANELEASLRWSAAVVERDPSLASALLLSCRILSSLGRVELSISGLELAVKRAIDAGALPLAVAAVADLRALGVNTSAPFAAIAAAFCSGSPRLQETAPPPPPLPQWGDVEPLSSFLSGPALLSKVGQIIHAATKAYSEAETSELPLIAPIPLFSALDQDGLRALIEAFNVITVPAGHDVIRQGDEGTEAYIVARGDLEVRRIGENDGANGVFARLNNGALFGEMALLSRAPRAASVVACRPSVLLVAKRDVLEAVAEARPDVGLALAAHCRRRMVANLVRSSPVLHAVAPGERHTLVEHFETRVFEKGDKLIQEGDDPSGLHLIASGEVAVFGNDNGERLLLRVLGPGETVGEVALVFRRPANADVVATHPSVSLFLPRLGFNALVRQHPFVLHGLYLLAMDRDDETSSVLSASSVVNVVDDYTLV